MVLDYEVFITSLHPSFNPANRFQLIRLNIKFHSDNNLAINDSHSVWNYNGNFRLCTKIKIVVKIFLSDGLIIELRSYDLTWLKMIHLAFKILKRKLQTYPLNLLVQKWFIIKSEREHFKNFSIFYIFMRGMKIKRE